MLKKLSEKLSKISLFKVVLFFRSEWRSITTSIVLSSLGQFSQLLVPLIFGYLVDSINKKDAYTTIVYLGLVLVLTMLFRWFYYFSDKYEINNIDFKLRDLVSYVSLSKILSLSLGQHYSQNSSYRSSVTGKGKDSMHSVVATSLYQLFPSIAHFVISAIMLLFLDIKIGLIAVTSISLYLILSFRYDVKMMDELNKLDEMGHQKNKSYNEAIRYADLVTVNAQQQKVIKEQTDLMNNFASYGKKIWISHDKKHLLYSHWRILGSFFVLAFCAYDVFFGIMTIGSLASIFAISNQAFGQVGNLAYGLRRLISELASVNSFTKLMEIEPVIISKKDAKEFVNGDIVFADVSFVYPSRSDDAEATETALKNLNFIIKKGEKVAFVGPSGSGKTTIINLLLRGFDPLVGKITIAGQDLQSVNLESYLRKVGYVEQKVNLFDQTIKYNLCFGLGESASGLTDEDLMKYIERAQLINLWPKLDKGFDTVIGEKGIKLSGGEGQRLGVARALIKEPDIIIFDEATSSLDAESEHEIQKAIDESSIGRTTIIVAHRLSTVLNCDRIYMVSNGEIIGSGSHVELLDACPEYRQLVQRQVNAFELMAV